LTVLGNKNKKKNKRNKKWFKAVSDNFYFFPVFIFLIYLIFNMRAVIQRVKNANVKVNDKIIGKIGFGLLILLAVHIDDEESVAGKMADKIVNLRIFEDNNKKMNLSIKDVGGETLIISQFTLYGDCSRGNRPNFTESARPDKAMSMYERFIKCLREHKIRVKTGKFGAMMEAELVNDGPVTIILDI